MLEKERTKSNPDPEPETRVLSDDELNSVSGGKVEPKEFVSFTGSTRRAPCCPSAPRAFS